MTVSKALRDALRLEAVQDVLDGEKRFAALYGNLLNVLPLIPENTFDSIIADPPYAISFMGKGWDDFGRKRKFKKKSGHKNTGLIKGSGRGSTPQFLSKHRVSSNEAFQREMTRYLREHLRVLKPGGYLLMFGGTRTYHRLACAIEDAGFEIRDSILCWAYGSGFPKSRNIGKEAKQWEGWGTSLKPAFEPIILARKPLSESTVAKNVLRWGTGAINIDATRISGTNPSIARRNSAAPKESVGSTGWRPPARPPSYNEQRAGEKSGRWPANLVLTHCSFGWYTIRHDCPKKVVKAICAYYSEKQTVRVLRKADLWYALGVSETKVLQSGLCRQRPQGGSQKDLGDDSVQTLRRGFSGDSRMGEKRTAQVLQSPLSRAVLAGRPASEIGQAAHKRVSRKDAPVEKGEPTKHGAFLSMEGRKDSCRQRVRPSDDCDAAGGVAEIGTENGARWQAVRPRTSDCGGGETTPPAETRRDCSSPKWEKGRQSGQKPDDDRSKVAFNCASKGRETVVPVASREQEAPRSGCFLEVVEEMIPVGWRRWFVFSQEGGCRKVGTTKEKAYTINRFKDGAKPFGGGAGHEYESSTHGGGESDVWACVPGCPVRMLDQQTGVLKSAKATKSIGQTKPGVFGGGRTTPENQYGDSGGASRFFYCSKANRRERDAGLDASKAQVEIRTGMAGRGQGGLKCKKCKKWKASGSPCVCKNPDFEKSAFVRPPVSNKHPTVKPLALMRYLCRLITPPNGVVLDPFMGSGSTLCAAVLEGFRAVGIDKTKEYVPIARMRTEHWAKQK